MRRETNKARLMASNLDRNIPVDPQSADRTFVGSVSLDGFTVGDYWRWTYSDLIGNTNRGSLAQFIVAQALGDTRKAVYTWEPCDECTRDGTTVEVKSAAFLQSWSQRTYSKISFRIAPALAWSQATGDWEGPGAVRHADVYVFALLSEKDKGKVNPLDLSQWDFYVLGTGLLNREFANAKSIALGSIKRFASEVNVDGLVAAVASIAGPHSAS